MQLQPETLLQGGKYRIIRTLGQGGFGITYEAEQILLHRKVAIKEFFMKDCCERDESTSLVTVGTGSQRQLVEKFRGKFIREAQMIAGMDHPNVVRVTDVFQENGTAYYVMDNLPGGSLSSKVKKNGPLSETEAEKYIREVAGALAYIHSLNTVHLDVKPSNILLNARGEAVLIDFGISKHYDSAGEQTSSTPVGQSKGFAPLEQSRDGDVSQFKPSTDIYALGATLYYLVTGATPPEASIAAEDGIPRPAGLSDHLWLVIEQSMKPFRRDRPQDISAFLRLLLQTEPVSKQKAEEDETIINEPKKKEQPYQEKKPSDIKKMRFHPITTCYLLLGLFICAVVAFISLLVIFTSLNDGSKIYYEILFTGISAIVAGAAVFLLLQKHKKSGVWLFAASAAVCAISEAILAVVFWPLLIALLILYGLTFAVLQIKNEQGVSAWKLLS